MIEVKIEKRGEWFVVRDAQKTLAKTKNGELVRRLYRASKNYKVVNKWS